jgi:hypothetical protein
MEEASQVITRAHTSYMEARATGLRSTNNLFDMSAAAVNATTIQAAGLTPLDPSEYVLIPVIFKPPFKEGDDWISTFTESIGYQYVARRGFYQLTLASVLVQAHKEIAVVEKKSGKVYTGKNARALLGLPDMNVTLKASQNPDYDIFIQSTSNNRKLLLGSKYLYLTPNITYARGQAVPPPAKVAVPKVAKMPLLPSTVAKRAAATAKANPFGSGKVKSDLNTPIYPSKSGRALWAGIKCPACPSKVNQRCQKSDGSPLEKPHAERKI